MSFRIKKSLSGKSYTHIIRHVVDSELSNRVLGIDKRVTEIGVSLISLSADNQKVLDRVDKIEKKSREQSSNIVSRLMSNRISLVEKELKRIGINSGVKIPRKILPFIEDSSETHSSETHSSETHSSETHSSETHSSETRDSSETLDSLDTLDIVNNSNKLCQAIISVSERVQKLEDKPLDVPDSVLCRISVIEQRSIDEDLLLKRIDELEKVGNSENPSLRLTEKTLDSLVDRIDKLESKNTLEDNNTSPQSQVSDEILVKLSEIQRESQESHGLVSSLSERIEKIEKLEKLDSTENSTNLISSLSDKIVAIEKQSTISKGINDRLSQVETKLSKPDLTKPLSDRISTLENKKIKMTDIPKSLLDRIQEVEKREVPDVSVLLEKMASLEKANKTLIDRILSLESDSGRLRLKLDSLVDEEYNSIQSVHSPSSNSMVHIK
jgi:hypothetical protein